MTRALPPPLRRSSAATSGLPANASIACRLPDMRQRVGNDQAHTDAAARFVLFELLPVLRSRARAFGRTGIRRRAREVRSISALTLLPRASD
jgi:hypothetical protein